MSAKRTPPGEGRVRAVSRVTVTHGTAVVLRRSDSLVASYRRRRFGAQIVDDQAPVAGDREILFEFLQSRVVPDTVIVHRQTSSVVGEIGMLDDLQRRADRAPGRDPTGRPVDMMDKARALRTSLQALQLQQDMINRFFGGMIRNGNTL